VSTQARLLYVNRSSLYYQPRPPSAEEVELKHRIDEIFTQCPFYGYRKVAEQLHREGRAINRKTVARYMQEMGLMAIFPGPNLSKRAHQAGIFPYLLRNLKVEQPDHVWGVDITYIRLWKGWMYAGFSPGLVFPLYSELGAGSKSATRLCASRDEKRFTTSQAADLHQ